MMKINYDKYGKKYYFNEISPMTFEELEIFKEELQAICADVYSEQLQAELDFGDDCESGACKI